MARCHCSVTDPNMMAYSWNISFVMSLCKTDSSLNFPFPGFTFPEKKTGTYFVRHLLGSSIWPPERDMWGIIKVSAETEGGPFFLSGLGGAVKPPPFGRLRDTFILESCVI